MLQGFYWNCVPQGGWYNIVASLATDIATNGFARVWFPPPQKGESKEFSVGYDPYDHYDLGGYSFGGVVETRYGSRAELQTAVDALRANGVKSCVDIVPNHLAGTNNSTYTAYPPALPVQFFLYASDVNGTPVFLNPVADPAPFLWHHFAFVKDDTAYRFFLDGMQVGSDVIVPNAAEYSFAANGNYSFATDHTGGQNSSFDGFLDEIRISDTALAPSQFLNAIPEPSALTLVALALAGFAALRRRGEASR